MQRESFDALPEALDALEERCRAIARAERRPKVRAGVRTFEPGQQVQARAELRGPGRVRAGVDVRGDGSTEAFAGRLRRRVLEEQRGESAYDALRRELTA